MLLDRTEVVQEQSRQKQSEHPEVLLRKNISYLVKCFCTWRI